MTIGILIVIGIIAYFLLFYQPSVPPSSGTGQVSSDLKETVTLSFKDALATTETTVNAKWIVFDKDGNYFDSGTAGTSTAGQDSFDGAVNSEYTLVAYLDTAASEYLPETVNIKTGDGSGKTETIKLTAESTLKMVDMTNSVDLDENLTGTAGSTEEVRLIINANESNSAVIPGVYFNANDTTVVDEIAMTKQDTARGSWKSITCPDRLTPTASTDKVWCFERDSRLASTDGNVIAYATLKFDSSTGPGDADVVTSTLMDKFIYTKPGYDSINGIIYDYENAADSDIGVPDSNTATSAYSD